MSAYEEVLEQRIEDAYQACLAAKTLEGKQQHFQNMRALSYRLTLEKILRVQQQEQLA